ncbi:MAG: hypothetical protein JXA66_00310 [Oligoflexia bacterium]|nr:hypothetical protein [Oligoflexia bacterium]
MKEAAKAGSVLLSVRNVVVDKKIHVPDISLCSGEVLWLEVEHELYAEIFVSLLLGLLEPEKGELSLAGRPLGRDVKKLVSYISSGYWLPCLEDLKLMVRILSISLSLQTSMVYDEFRKNSEGLGITYALKMKLAEMKPWTKRRVVTALGMSMPALLVPLVEPFQGLETQESVFLGDRINEYAAEGTSFIILCSEEPPVYSKHVKFGTGGK